MQKNKINKIELELTSNEDYSYDIYIEPGIIKDIPKYLKELDLKGKFAIITDSNVNELYAKDLYKSLLDNNFSGEIVSFKAGEKSKTRKTKAYIEDFMLSKSLGRDSFIIALGGGVTGDLAGFIASTYNRGIPFIQIPTTLLSMVDSSVGGKTGIDTKHGKNLIGTFYQPKAVFIDPETLKTLDVKELQNGIAEIIKHAVIRDKLLFKDIIEKRDLIINLDMDVLKDIITRNVKIKSLVVAEDEKEGNVRRILNFGHTIGHAVELLMNYKMSHGECVAIGMAVESELSSLEKILPEDDADRIISCINSFNLPTNIPSKLKADNIIKATYSDKKVKKGKPLYALPALIGLMYDIDGDFGLEVNEANLKTAISKRVK